MSRIKEAFAGGKAFIPFITCGDPDLDTTKEIVRAMEILLNLASRFQTRPQKVR